METTERPARLDLRAHLRRTHRSTLYRGLALIFGPPALAVLVGALTWGRPGLYGPVVGVVGVPVMLVGVVLLALAWGNRRDPGRLDGFQWPEVGTVDAVMDAVEADWHDAPPRKIRAWDGRYFMTPHWLLEIGGTTLECYPLHALAWAFAMTKGNPLVNTLNRAKPEPSTTVMAHFTNGRWFMVILDSDEDTAAFLALLERRAPWAFFGHSPEMLHSWQHDRERWVAAVRQRHAAARQMVRKGEAA